MAHTFCFNRDKNGYTTDPVMDAIRIAARDQKWVGKAGFKEWAKENYNATLRAGIYDDWTSISFKSEKDMKKFSEDFRVDAIRANIDEYTAMNEQERLEWIREQLA